MKLLKYPNIIQKYIKTLHILKGLLKQPTRSKNRKPLLQLNCNKNSSAFNMFKINKE